MLKYTNIQLLSYESGTKAVIVHKQDEFTLPKRNVIRNGYFGCWVTWVRVWGKKNLTEKKEQPVL